MWGENSDHVLLESSFGDRFVRKEKNVEKKKGGRVKWNFDEETDWGVFKKLLDDSLEKLEVVNNFDIDEMGQILVNSLVESLVPNKERKETQEISTCGFGCNRGK